MNTNVSIFFGLLLIPFLSHAALVFDETVIQQSANIRDTEATASFHFKNTGNREIKVIDVRSSCGCTVANMKKRVYPAGESGRVDVVFAFEGRKGKQEKFVTLKTIQSGTYKLKLEVDIPTPIKAYPRLLRWESGMARDSKQATVEVLQSAGMTAPQLKHVPENVTAQLKPTANGTWQLEVCPDENASTTTDRIVIEALDQKNNCYSTNLFILLR